MKSLNEQLKYNEALIPILFHEPLQEVSIKLNFTENFWALIFFHLVSVACGGKISYSKHNNASLILIELFSSRFPEVVIIAKRLYFQWPGWS